MGQIINRIEKYCNDILYNQPSCLMIKKAVERYKSDWNRDDLYFDEKAAELVVGYIENLKHFKGDLAGQYIHLEDWQVFMVSNIFGWKRKKTRKRRYTYADVLVPRKNGKTTIAAGIGLFCESMDGESGAEVYAAAVDKEQAKICFDSAKELLKGSIFEKMFKVYTGSITYPDKASFFKPLSKDTKNKDGLNPQAAICDERHAWQTNEIYDVIKTGIGARSQPLVFSISTAGVDTSLPYYSDIQVLKDVMLGIKEKDNHFIMLYIPDDTDEWDDPVTWRKVNPNYGVSLSADYMQNEYLDAKLKGGTTEAAFKTKNLNMWVDAPEVWISDDAVKTCNTPIEADTLLKKSCYVGIDLARKTDITAVSFFFPDTMSFKYLFCVPEAKVQEQDDRVDYRKWAADGWITITPGSVMDEDYFMALLIKELDKYNVKAICYDPWGMWNMLSKFGRYESVLMEYQQNIHSMSVPTKEFESMILKQKINFGCNPVIRWMLKNVVIYTDPNGNIKLDKHKARNKIDGVVASVDAIGGWLTKTQGKTGEIYKDHTLRTFKI